MVAGDSPTDFILLILRHDTNKTVDLKDCNRDDLKSSELIGENFSTLGVSLELTLRQMMKKTTVKSVPVSGSNFKWPNMMM